MAVVSLKLAPRSVTGKKVRRLRASGKVPVHLYGRGVESRTLQADANALRRLLPQVGANIPLSIELEGSEGEDICFVREIQRHPVTEEVLHVDFLRVDVSRAIQAEVPITLTGTAPAVRGMGGTLLQSLTTLLVEALPMEIPASFDVDTSHLDDFEKRIYARDIPLGDGVTLMIEPDELVARVNPPRVELEDEVEGEEEAEAEEGIEDGAPGDATSEEG